METTTKVEPTSTIITTTPGVCERAKHAILCECWLLMNNRQLGTSQMGDTLTGQQESDCRATKFNPNLTLTTVLLNTARDRKGLPGKVSRVRVKKHFITLSNIPNNRVYTNDKVMPLIFHSLLMLVLDRHVCFSSLLTICVNLGYTALLCGFWVVPYALCSPLRFFVWPANPRLVEHQLHSISLMTQVGTRTDHGLQNGGCCRRKTAIKSVQSTILRCCCSRFLCFKCLLISAAVLSISYIFDFRLIIAENDYMPYSRSLYRILFGNESATSGHHVYNILTNQ